MSALLTDATAVVTGATNGIGRGIALSLARHGADVVVTDVDREPRRDDLAPTHRTIERETDASATFSECDVTQYDDFVAACDVAEEFGGIDVMVNNAGIFRDVSFLDTTSEDFDSVVVVNLKGTFYGCQAAAERMQGTGRGSIINVTSVGAETGFEGGAVYCASKGGVKSMTFALAETLGPSIRVNALEPGYTDETGFATDTQEMKRQRGNETALGRLATPRDVGDTAVFLASDLAEYITGESILVDGGWVHTRGSYD
ncbi:SDR family NAD(P)-dependent oxidoreductase [Halostagnicola bangensis]